MTDVGHITRHDLNIINNIVQNSHVAYIKEKVISILRDEYSKDSYYHYVSDEFGFPKVINHRNLSLGAGYDDDDVTRIFIGEAYRHDIIFYPSVLIKASGNKSVPISFNRNKETVQYEAVTVVDGYGNQTYVTTPSSFLFQGAWEGSITLDVVTRDILARDDIAAFCAILFVDVRFEELLRAGILIKNLSVTTPSENLDRNQEKLYKQSIVLEIRSEWRREIPINNLIDFINICVDFGRSSETIAPNLAINVIASDEENIINESLSNAPWENENIFGISRSSLIASGSLLANLNIFGNSVLQLSTNGSLAANVDISGIVSSQLSTNGTLFGTGSILGLSALQLSTSGTLEEAYSVILPGTWSGYLDADVDTTINTGVSLWESQDGTIDAVQAVGANQPLLITNWLSSGRRALDFNGSSHYLTLNPFAALVTGDISFRIAIHMSFDVAPATGGRFFGLGNTAGTSPFRQIYQDTANNRLAFGSHDGTTSEIELGSSSVVSANTEYVICAHYNASSHTVSLWRNTTQDIINATHNKSSAVNVASLGCLLRNAATLFLNGKIRRFAFGLGTFSSGDVTALQAWLGT